MIEKNKINILFACEESDECRCRFEEMGFNAWSCDLQKNRNPKAKHYHGSVFDIINLKWDCIIAFPPCTHLAVSGAAHFAKKISDGRQQEGIDFFMEMVKAIELTGCGAIENPIGIMSGIYKKPSQIIQPYYFGDEAQKSTCLWLKNLPHLFHNDKPNLFNEPITHVSKGEMFEWIDGKTGKKKRQPKWFADAWKLNKEERAKVRSKTFPGIATAIANQWGSYLIKHFRK